MNRKANHRSWPARVVLGVLVAVSVPALGGCAPRGTNLVVDGGIVTLPADQLGNSIVRITEVEDAIDVVELDGQQFSTSAPLIDYLRAQPSARFAHGILLEFVNKEAGTGNLRNDMIDFSVERNIDLFAVSRASKGSVDAVWLVRSTVTTYAQP